MIGVPLLYIGLCLTVSASNCVIFYHGTWFKSMFTKSVYICFVQVNLSSHYFYLFRPECFEGFVICNIPV